jgi:hypothetical protein
MGHDSERAALIYLHSSAERQRNLADAVGDVARAELAKSETRKTAKSSGTRRARDRRSSAQPAEDQRPERVTYRLAGNAVLRPHERLVRTTR